MRVGGLGSPEIEGDRSLGPRAGPGGLFIAQPGLTSLVICGSPYGSVSLEFVVSLQCPRVARKGCRLVSAGFWEFEPMASGSRGYQRLRCVHGAEAEVDGVVTYR